MSDDHIEKFINIHLQEEYDTHDSNGRRSKIIDIVAAGDILFALAQSGICAAFNLETNQRICFLNVSHDEVIRSLFYNKTNGSLITVSVYASDSFRSLNCRTTGIEFIKRGMPNAGFAIFESESLGFVEFDDVNDKILTFSTHSSVYKVFDLNNYTRLYSIADANIQEIKISRGILLLIYYRARGYVPLKIISVEDGTVLKTFNHLLHPNKKVEFIELFNEMLLVKQKNENLQIVDVCDLELIEVCRTEFITPSAFIFLPENQLFVTIRNGKLAVWNFDGELVTLFEDLSLWNLHCKKNNIYITSDEDLIISYCKDDIDDSSTQGNAGCINISNIQTGECLVKVTAVDDTLSDACIQDRWITRSVAEALEDTTALFYNEERNEIYTGDKLGLVHVWAN